MRLSSRSMSRPRCWAMSSVALGKARIMTNGFADCKELQGMFDKNNFLD